MSRRAAWLVLGGLALAALLAGWLLPGRRAPREAPEPATRAALAEERSVRLYFPGPEELLVGEERTVAAGDEETLARAILAELLAGPRTAGLHAPLPEGTELATLHIGRTGVAYVDLDAPADTGRPSFGSRQELLAAYSLVNSLAENLPHLAGVALVWNGSQNPTFAGNLDTRHPLVPDRTLVATP